MEEFYQLSYHERYKIYRGICQGKSRREIAKELQRSPSTISREVRRNSDQYGYLYTGEAHEMAKKRKNKNKPKIIENLALKNYIMEKMRCERWSPKTIAGRWNAENLDQKISPEAIYQWIYSENGERLEAKKFLIRMHKKRGLRRKIKTSKIKNKVSIHVRPDVINQRLEPGHYEGDLIFNTGSQSQNVATFVDRFTRHAILIKNENKQSKTVIKALIQHLQETDIIMKSITFDNGSEFAEHAKLKQLGIDVYFCDPGSPWQKGSIENLNGMVRRYLPFSIPAHEITQEYVKQTNIKINNMPREILGYRTPIEVFRRVMHA